MPMPDRVSVLFALVVKLAQVGRGLNPWNTKSVKCAKPSFYRIPFKAYRRWLLQNGNTSPSTLC